MGWTAPASWSVSEIVLASKMNTHIRDNLDYLKGNAGAVAISDRVGITVAANNTTGDLSLDGAYGAINDYHQIGWLGVSAIRGIASAGGEMSFDFILQSAGSGTIATGRNVMRMNGGNGNVGIGTTSPQGKIHAVGAGGGFMFLSANAVDGTLQTLAVAGTVTQFASFYAIGRNNTGGGVATLNPGNATGLNQLINFPAGLTDTVTIGVTAGGAITVQRTAGANATHQVLMLVLYK
jgi:hypothetical protein